MKTRVLVISDSPFLNFDTSLYSYDLIKLLIKKDIQVYNLILSTIVDTEYDYIKGDFSTLDKIHNDIGDVPEDDRELLKKVIYIYRCKNFIVDNAFVDSLIDSNQITLVISCISITSNIRLSGKLKVPLILNLKMDYNPITKIHYDMINTAQVLISNTEHGNQKIIESLEQTNKEERIIYRINPSIDFNELDNVILNRKTIRSNLRKKLGIPEKCIVFFLDLNCINMADMERKCIDSSIKLFKEYLKENPNSFLLINSIINTSLKDIVTVLKIPTSKYFIINDFYQDSSIKLRNMRRQLYVSSDILLGLSGGEDYNLSIIESQYVGLPVLFNNITSYEEVKYLGTMNEKIQQIYILGEIQSYVNMPIIRNCLDKIRYMVKNYSKFRYNKDISNKLRDIYSKDFDEKWDILLEGF